MRARHLSATGFSLIELLMVIAVLAMLMAFSIPFMRVGDRAKVDNAVSRVRETLQTARLRAVAVNKPLQVRFNCPDTGQFRIVESGFAEDGRCSTTLYPYPGDPDGAYQDPPKPRYDGPPQSVDPRVALSSSDPYLVLQFKPDGRTVKMVNGAEQTIAMVPVTVSANGYQRTLEINGLGKVIANR